MEEKNKERRMLKVLREEIRLYEKKKRGQMSEGEVQKRMVKGGEQMEPRGAGKYSRLL